MNPVVSQPGYGSAVSASSDWQTGPFDCFDDIGICLCGAFCPLCLSCQIASDMNEFCLCGSSVAMRTMYRTRYGIPVIKDPTGPPMERAFKTLPSSSFYSFSRHSSFSNFFFCQ
ncbi:placenta-specific gene 8 protein isoform X2 [Bubalus bubalis]|uniref:placenta-specific gene 8 protein isoform X2 n=1 Tax=Bubalus bubalis TaxID=89462 RepID=UPI001D128CD6|nr:placenta-specific gene 8 protein isoform X2 [Bubalus bubalis]XP_044801646.1 placenta-specific gene 8 protein isoform X2 [Bubalus bubalis]